jgi:hypothetical protein
MLHNMYVELDISISNLINNKKAIKWLGYHLIGESETALRAARFEAAVVQSILQF